MSPSSKRRLLALVAAVMAVLGLASARPAAAAEGSIKTYRVEARLNQTGILDYSATIDLSDSNLSEFTMVLLTKRSGLDAAVNDRTLVHNFTISNLSASVNGAAVQFTRQDKADSIILHFQGLQQTQPVHLTYQVSGTTHAQPDGRVLFSWPVVQGVSVPIQQVVGTVSPPSRILEYKCQTGDDVGRDSCALFGGNSESGNDMSFEQKQLAANRVVAVGMELDSNGAAITESNTHTWTLDRAFGHSVPDVVVALAALAAGALLLHFLWRRIGSDLAGGEPTKVAEFEAVGEGQVSFVVHEQARPGLVGTVADEHADPVDVAATLLDLAARGYLVVTQLPQLGPTQPMDWSFRRGDADPSQLADYERTLLDAVAPSTGNGMLVSQADALNEVINAVQDQLYDEVVARGWFAHRPDSVRSGYARLGWLAVGLSVVVLVGLAAFTTLGILGLVLVGLACGLLRLSSMMPARTAKGSALLAGLEILAGQLLVQRTDQMSKRDELGELSKVLAYAVVLGGSRRWVDAMVAVDDDPDPDPDDIPWYRAPADWHLRDLPACLDGFITALQGRLTRR